VELNTRGRYAVMAMADLAKHQGDAAVPLSAIAERQGLSLPYLEQIFLQLRRAALVESERGRSGGYRLSRPAATISVAEVMSAVQEETRMTRCLDDEGGGCLRDEKCLTHDLWHALGLHIRHFLSNVSLQEVVDGLPRAQAGPAGKAPADVLPAGINAGIE
jgi:Rrf2 family iron-sulfur cluster assembly transcriptional regulator